MNTAQIQNYVICSGALVKALKTLGREDAAKVLLNGCSLYRIVPCHKH